MQLKKRQLSALSLAAVTALGLTACGGGSDPAAEENMNTEMNSESPAPEMTESEDMASESPAMDPAANLVGPGCEGYAEQVPDGAGSISGMALDPVATAASNNPILTSLTAAVSGGINPDVDLVDTLNSGEYTVFAPVDDAFAQLDEETMAMLMEDSDMLTGILTYHVIEGQISPDEIAGEHTTLNGEMLMVEGSGSEITVNGNASVICGGVQTANATVYLVDSVLMPGGGM